MTFSHLAAYLEKLEETRSRNEITKVLAELLKKTSAQEIDKTCYLLLGELVPAYRGMELNVAEKMAMRVISAAFDRKPAEIAAQYRTRGDLGDAAAHIVAAQKRPEKNISVSAVYDALLSGTQETGAGSRERKIKILAELLRSLDARSIKFVVRILLGKLRLGFSDATLLDAFSYMETGDKSARSRIEHAYNFIADIGAIAKKIKAHGLRALDRITPAPGTPIRPSLAERVKDIGEVIGKTGPRVGLEQKLDGFRTQIHVWQEADKKEVALFSRNLENTTAMFPEIVNAAEKLPVTNVILDGETIGFYPSTGKFAPFQETVQRKRKHDITAFAKKIPLSIFIFDILYLDGKPLVALSFRERRKTLERLFTRNNNKTIRLTTQQETGNPKVIAAELRRSIALGLEGLVAKNLETAYEAGSRGFHWVKLKSTTAALDKLRAADHGASKLPDTIDCIVMGAYKGRGKRTSFGVGGLLLGVRGSNDRYYSISRLGTGLSDAQFREAKKRVNALKTAEPPKEYIIGKGVTPDLWIRSALVAEILADEITLSPRHAAGRKKEGGRGYSLRFPRLVRFRDDKNPEDATTIAEIETMYKKQKR